MSESYFSLLGEHGRQRIIHDGFSCLAGGLWWRFQPFSNMDSAKH